MQKLVLITFFLSIVFCLHAQTDSFHIKDSKAYQVQLNKEFADPETSPLLSEDLKDFQSLDFFPVNKDLIVTADFIRTPGQMPFQMPTTTGRLPVYEKYGEAHFILEGKQVILEIFQSHDLRETEEYKDYLFMPFTDLTNGEETYGGGRYLGLTIPEGDSIVINFNKAYNPYCAYNGKYSCPRVPVQNHIDAEITAGVKAFD